MNYRTQSMLHFLILWSTSLFDKFESCIVHVFILLLLPFVACRLILGRFIHFDIFLSELSKNFSLRLLALVTNPKFKPNSALVVVDFLVRHGFIKESHQGNHNYRWLHLRSIEFPIKRTNILRVIQGGP